MAFGEILRNARIQKGFAPSDVAEGTRMLVQIVDALEREDLKRIAAPIYGRGFVKLYAEFLELDHEPLVRDFMELYEGGRAPSIRLKTPEVRVDPAPVPVTRTVSESALPDRHAIKPQAAIKAVETDSALEVTDGADDGVEKPKIRDVAMAVDDGVVRMAQQEEDMALVVSPEEEDADAVNEPDLFNLSSPPRHKPEVIKNAASGKAAEEKPHLTRRNQRL
ncbi:MAG: helix-turn-helix domain-containing protein, partial [Kiritimatiellae bacterium]|nr:helix-turn-helix domain-containing protein [Kiritimatiellia bacterium]